MEVRMTANTTILSKRRHFDFLGSLFPEATLTEELPTEHGFQLVCFGSGLLVPEKTLRLFEGMVNFHAAPPSYPGRDPHHWAAYDRAVIYGATAHFMWPSVDAGPICGVLLQGIQPGTPQDYLAVGEAAARALLVAWRGGAMSFDANAPPLVWSGTKRSRKDLIGMCDMRQCDEAEKKRRKMAFSGFEANFLEANPYA
jgi:methionyl-tRNA formyltransferase